MNALARITGSALRALGLGRPRAGASVGPLGLGGFQAGGLGGLFSGWRPALRDTRDDVRAAWSSTNARAVNAIQNSGWLSGAIDQVVASTVGAGLRLNAKPDAAALGWQPADATAWARAVEKRWQAWALQPLECDAAGRQTMGQMTAAAFRSFLATGEYVATLPWVERPVSITRTKVQLFQSHRLSQTTLGLNLFQGVFLDGTGMPVGYRFRPAMYPGQSPEISALEVDVPARDRLGRPVVVHGFDGLAGQVRGISPLAPALKVVRQYDQLADATLTAALIQAIFAATVKSEAPTADMLDALRSKEEQDAATAADEGGIDALFGARDAWYKTSRIDIGQFGKITHLFPGDSLDFKRSEHPNSTYEAFSKFLLREVARCLGITFEDFSGDYSGSSYAAINNATSIVWRVAEYRRAHVLRILPQLTYEAWLEEEVHAGRVAVPGGPEAFAANRAALCQADWRGPAKPQSDLLKAGKAYQTLLQAGVISRSAICDDMGTSYVDTVHELADEAALRTEMGVPDPDAPPAADPLADRLLTDKDEQ